MMITGSILKGDMSFKMAKKIMADGGGQFDCIYTLMNEYGQILGYWFGENAVDVGELGPELFYTDSCCEEHSLQMAGRNLVVVDEPQKVVRAITDLHGCVGILVD